MPEREDVIAANRAFYRAFEGLQVESMEKVWSRDASIVCIHPGWRKLEGWGPVMNSWERIFDNVFEMKFEIVQLSIRISGDLAVVVTEENLTQRGYDGIGRSQVLATNVFERSGQKWFLVLHQGSPVMQAPGEETPLQ
jgi:ketosteroid isomerase-like protein